MADGEAREARDGIDRVAGGLMRPLGASWEPHRQAGPGLRRARSWEQQHAAAGATGMEAATAQEAERSLRERVRRQRVTAPAQAAAVRELVERLSEEKARLIDELEAEQRGRTRLEQDVQVLREMLREHNVLVLELQAAKETLQAQLERAEDFGECPGMAEQLRAEGLPLDRRKLYAYLMQERAKAKGLEERLKREVLDERAENQLLRLALGEEVEFAEDSCQARVRLAERRLEEQAREYDERLQQALHLIEGANLERDKCRQRSMVNACTLALRTAELEALQKRMAAAEAAAAAASDGASDGDLRCNLERVLLAKQVHAAHYELRAALSRVADAEAAREAEAIRAEDLSRRLFRAEASLRAAHKQLEAVDSSALHDNAVALDERALMADEDRAALARALEDARQSLVEAEQRADKLPATEARLEACEAARERAEESAQALSAALAEAKAEAEAAKVEAKAAVAEAEAKTGAMEAEARAKEEADAEAEADEDWREACLEAQVQVDVLKARLAEEQRLRASLEEQYKGKFEHLERAVHTRDVLLHESLAAAGEAEVELGQAKGAAQAQLARRGLEERFTCNGSVALERSLRVKVAAEGRYDDNEEEEAEEECKV